VAVGTDDASVSHESKVSAGGKAGPAAPVGEAGRVAAGGFLGQHHAQHFARVPPLRPAGGDHLGGRTAQIRQSQAPGEPVDFGFELLRRRGHGLTSLPAGGPGLGDFGPR